MAGVVDQLDLGAGDGRAGTRRRRRDGRGRPGRPTRAASAPSRGGAAGRSPLSGIGQMNCRMLAIRIAAWNSASGSSIGRGEERRQRAVRVGQHEAGQLARAACRRCRGWGASSRHSPIGAMSTSWSTRSGLWRPSRPPPCRRRSARRRVARRQPEGVEQLVVVEDEVPEVARRARGPSTARRRGARARRRCSARPGRRGTGPT